MASLQLTFASFKEDHGRKPQVWGAVDCCLVLADWMVWLGHPDPATNLRGSYDSEDGCRAVIRAAGGLRPIIEECNRRVGWRTVETPRVGFVAVIGSPIAINRQWGAIWNGERWDVRMKEGFVAVSARPFVIWGNE